MELIGHDNPDIPVTDLIGTFRKIIKANDIKGELGSSGLAFRVAVPMWWHDDSSQRFFFIGNEHRDIYNFIRASESISPTNRPITIVNFDEHRDDSQYLASEVPNGIGLNAAWQRYIVDTGITDFEHSYNIYPDKHMIQLSKYTQEISLNQSWETLNKLKTIDLLSVDLDFFNKLQPESKRWKQAVERLITCARKAKSVMIFCSPVFTQHLKGIEIAQQLFRSLSTT